MNTETITGPFVGMTTYGERAKPDWRSRCIVKKAKDGTWDVWSPDEKRYLARPSDPKWYGACPCISIESGCFDDETDAREALAKAPPYPGAEA